MGEVRDQFTPGEVRKTATEIVRALVDQGHVAYFAGGCVRDRLLGIEPLDYDVATDARPEAVRDIFRRTQRVGESFGVVLVRSGGVTVEVATFRTDGVYSDGRHPDEVEFSDEEHDASRRDFTINGLFEDPLNDRIIDYVEGRADLEKRIIRAIGDPAARIAEDRLRMLRAVRFAARFGFSIDEDTAAAISTNAATLSGVSRERIGQELKRMLTNESRGVAAWELQYLGLDVPALNESNLKVAPTRLGRLPAETPYPTALAAWLLDRHVESGQYDRIAARWSSALMLSNMDRGKLLACLDAFQTLCTSWGRLGVAGQKRLAARPEFTEGLRILQTVDRQAFIDVRRRVTELAESGLAPAPLLTGDDLLEMGIEPGSIYRRLMDAVYDAQLEGAIDDAGAARRLAARLVSTFRGASERGERQTDGGSDPG